MTQIRCARVHTVVTRTTGFWKDTLLHTIPNRGARPADIDDHSKHCCIASGADGLYR